MTRVYRCKCRACGKSLTTDSAYKIVVGEKNVYFCNKQEYKEYEEAELVRKQKTEKLNCAKEWFEYILRDEGYIQWSLVLRLIEELELGYSIEQIAEYLESEATDLKRALGNKKFKNFYNTIQYLRAVIYAQINEYFELDKEPEKRETVVLEDFYMPEKTKYKVQPKRKTMVELETEDDEDDEM